MIIPAAQAKAEGIGNNTMTLLQGPGGNDMTGAFGYQGARNVS